MNLLKISIFFVGLFVIGLVSFHYANAEVWIPDNEFGGYFDSNGFLFVTERSDDEIKVRGIRFSTGHIEDMIKEHM